LEEEERRVRLEVLVEFVLAQFEQEFLVVLDVLEVEFL